MLTRYATIASTAATSRHLINRYHGLRRYDLVDSPTNAPKARRDGKTSRAGRVPAAGGRRSQVCDTQRQLDNTNDDRQPYHVGYVSPRPNTEIDRSSSPSPIHHRQRLQLNRRLPDTCEDDLQSTSARSASIWSGSVHDTKFENNKFGNTYLLGDGGYPCRNYLLTLLLNSRTDTKRKYQSLKLCVVRKVQRVVRNLKIHRIIVVNVRYIRGIYSVLLALSIFLWSLVNTISIGTKIV
ncbi:putative nuclease HARBI1 [Aphis craccivora]|uniref:Putative nuclease HARBI1 n=1 Tax=Aphis craccivora TaxID=307492 RepID=A0A6G0ZAC6_APHCR|nr:putative nuclease HARBI1 [Aphis craccivora]